MPSRTRLRGGGLELEVDELGWFIAGTHQEDEEQ
jgi:hypothetical protein